MIKRWLQVTGLLGCMLLSVPAWAAADRLDIEAGDQSLTVDRYVAEGRYLLIWIAPGFGSHQRVFDTAQALADRGIEVWHVDLAESLFLTGGTSTMRSLDGRYVATLIEAAHAQTGKQVVLLSRAYGVLPLLKGAREWQLRHVNDKADYLVGAVLFSPEMYSAIPALGLEPEYEPIARATNLPIMIYQGGTRGNRWQLPDLLAQLYGSGSATFVQLLPGVTGLFYEGDIAPATLQMLKIIPDRIVASVKFIDQIAVPRQPAALPQETKTAGGRGLDISLQPYRGTVVPTPLDLVSASGEHIRRDNYLGKVTVINFWATWCPPCVEEIPSLNNLRKQMQGEPFELISVNYAEDPQVIRDFLKRVNVDFPVLLDPQGRVSANWNVIAYPSTFVIGPDGKIRYGVNAAIHWDSPEVVKAIRQLLQNRK